MYPAVCLPFFVDQWDTMHLFPPLVYTEGALDTRAKGRKSDNMADHSINVA